MPYSNLPQSMWGKMDDCKKQVMKKGQDEKSAIAICYNSLMHGKELLQAMKEYTEKATADINNLPDSAFLYVEDGGSKDDENKTVPRDLRHLPYKNADGSIDLPRLRNALSRLGQSDTGTAGGDKWLTSGVRDRLRAKAEKILADATNQKARKEIHYCHTTKSIMDAPNLRAEDAQACFNCRYYQLVDSPSVPMMMNDTPDGEGICTQYDFLTDADWTCDGWEAIPPEMMTMKQADGHYRWVGFSSSSYQDNDKEIVSQKALEQDAERMNATSDFGTLDWWHTPIVLGKCDTSFMHGHISIESGTFDDDWIGEQFANMKELGMSRTFYNPANEPDAQGVYHNIKTFSRAILPAERASNRLTLIEVSAKENKMSVVDKAKELAKRLGGTPEAEKKVDELLKSAEQVDQAAQAANLQQKETAAPVAPEVKPETRDAEPKAWFVGDMTPDEFDARLQKAVDKFLTPAIKEIGEQVAKLNEAQAVTAKEQGDKLAAQIKSNQEMQTELAARLAALEGLKPRGYRPTEDSGNITDKETVKAKTPKGDKQAEDNLSAWLAQM